LGGFVWTEKEGIEAVKKAIVVRLPPEGDIGDLVQIARAEGKRLFHGKRVKVVEAFRTGKNGEWVAVVQNWEIVSESRIEIERSSIMANCKNPRRSSKQADAQWEAHMSKGRNNPKGRAV
jgi:hypothetical protein